MNYHAGLQAQRQQRSCECVHNILQTASPIMHERAVAFDVIVDISDQITSQWKITIGCEQCRNDEHTTPILTQIAASLLNFYEAALSCYSLTKSEESAQVAGHGATSIASRTPSHHTLSVISLSKTEQASLGPLTVPSASRSCVPSEMILGDLTLEKSEARVLAEQLLGDCLLHLDSGLEEVKGMVDDQLQDYKWHANPRLIACDDLIVKTMNRLAILIGQLRSNAGAKR